MNPEHLFLTRIKVLFILLIILIGTSFSEEISKDFLGWSLVFSLGGESSGMTLFQDASAIDLDSEGNLYIVDRGKNSVLKFSENFEFLKEIGGFGDGREQFSAPQDVCAQSTLNIYVTDYNNNRISRFDANLNYLGEYRPSREDPIYYEMPLSAAVSGQYDIFVLEDLNKRIIKLDRFNQAQVLFGDNPQDLGQLLSPVQIAVSRDGKIFVSDPGSRSVIVFDYLGNFIFELKHPEFRQPSGIFLYSDNDLLVADPEEQKIFYFKNGNRFSGSMDLKSAAVNPIDVALMTIKGSGTSLLYVLSSTTCLIFINEHFK